MLTSRTAIMFASAIYMSRLQSELEFLCAGAARARPPPCLREPVTPTIAAEHEESGKS